ncbi:MAG TPA: hypothetical protein PL187_22665 [Caldilinea sp.]|nr:hypothetical protein [Caldilinea sp.]
MTDTSDKAIEALAAAPWAYASADLSAMIIALQAERNQLITTTEADARVEAAVLEEREAAKSMVWTLGHEIKASMLVDEDNEQAVLDMVKATAAAIRARGVTG